MRIEYLEYFLEVAKTGSISHAAKKLYISQQGLSRIIQTIEQQFEIQLFDRYNNTLQLTTEGKRFAGEAAKVTAAYKHLQLLAASCGELPQPEEGYIKVITTPFVLTVLFPFLEDFFVASPFNDMLRISEKSIPEILCALPPDSEKGIHIISLPSYTIDQIDVANSQFEPLVSTEIMLLVNQNCPIAEKEFVEKIDICSLPLIYYNEDLLEDVLRHLCTGNNKQDMHMKISDVRMIIEKVKKNEAVTITDSLSVFLYKISENLVSIPIKDSVSMEIGIFSRPDEIRSANEIAFIEFFKKCLRALCGSYLKHTSITF